MFLPTQGCAVTYSVLQEADSKEFKAQLKTKDEEAQRATKDNEAHLAELEVKGRLLGELNSELADQERELESGRTDIAKLQADNLLLQQSSQLAQVCVILSLCYIAIS